MPAPTLGSRLLSLLTLRGLSLDAKIFAGFGVILAMLCTFGLFTLFNLSRVRGETAAVNKRDMPVLDIAKRLQTTVGEVSTATTRYGYTLDPADGDAPLEKFGGLEKDLAAIQTQPAVEANAEVRDRLAAFAKEMARFAGKTADDGTREGAFPALAAAVDEMRDQRSNVEDTEDTFSNYVRKIGAAQRENMRTGKGGPQAQVNERLVLVDDILALTAKGFAQTEQGIAQRRVAFIESAVQSFDQISAKMDRLIEITPADNAWKVTAAGVGLARKDDISNAQSQAGIYKNFLANFLTAWKTMEAANAACEGAVKNLQGMANGLAETASTGASQRAGSAVGVIDMVSRTTLIALPLMVALGILGAWLISRLIASSIRGIVTTISQSLARKTEETLLTADQFTRAGEQIALQATKQAAAVQQTSASLFQLATSTRRTTERAETARTLAGDARGAAEQGAQEMKTMNDALGTVRDSGQHLQESMSSLGELSQDISQVMREIDAIAFQTNILALNAGVEAARAGSHGKGFAVVAEEVRRLAQRSAQASRRSGERIETVLHRISEGSRRSEEVIQRVDAIARAAEQVDGQLRSIVERVRRVDAMMTEIAAAAHEQDGGLQHINLAVREIDQITQVNAGAAQETAQSARLLREQAAAVRQSVLELSTQVLGKSSKSRKPGKEKAAAAPRRPAQGPGHSPKVSVPSSPRQAGRNGARPAQARPNLPEPHAPVPTLHLEKHARRASARD